MLYIIKNQKLKKKCELPTYFKYNLEFLYHKSRPLKTIFVNPLDSLIGLYFKCANCWKPTKPHFTLEILSTHTNNEHTN